MPLPSPVHGFRPPRHGFGRGLFVFILGEYAHNLPTAQSTPARAYATTDIRTAVRPLLRKIYISRINQHSPLASANTPPDPGGANARSGGLPPSIAENSKSEPKPGGWWSGVGVGSNVDIAIGISIFSPLTVQCPYDSVVVKGGADPTAHPSIHLRLEWQ